MRRLLTWAGVDHAQWKALTIVALKLDFRQMSFGRASWGQDVKGAAVLIGQLLFYTMFGFFMGLAIWFIPDLFLAGMLLVSVLVFVVGTTILLEHNSALTSPLDYPVLGFRPISSRTYFAARLANVLVYTTAITTVAAWLPMAALFVRHGPAVGAAGMAAVYVCSTTVALGVLLVYASMLRFVGADRLKRALSYVQLAMSFLVYGGYALFARVLDDSALSAFAVTKTPALLLFPGAWYASYLDIAAGPSGPMEWLPAAFSLVLLGALVASLGSRLTLDYSERLAALSSSSVKPRRVGAAGRATSRRWFRADEAGAMALLIRSQFKNDQRFRLAVLSILPLTILYVFMGLRGGTLPDPFDASARQGPPLVAVAMLLFPSMLKMAVTRSDSFRASWVFFACPVDRMKLVRSTKNVLVVYFLLPYLAFVTAVYLYFVPNLLHVGVHLALIGLMSHLCLQFVTFMEPDLPFSKPPAKGRASTGTFALIMVIFIVMGFFQAVAARMYQSLLLTLGAFAFVIALSVVLDLMTRARVDRETRALEFAG